MREIKFRGKVLEGGWEYATPKSDWWEQFWALVDMETVGEYVGLKDKNTTCQDIYEGDIIDENGKVTGNVYENSPLHERRACLLVQGLGTKTWCATYQEAVARGCTDTE